MSEQLRIGQPVFRRLAGPDRRGAGVRRDDGMALRDAASKVTRWPDCRPRTSQRCGRPTFEGGYPVQQPFPHAGKRRALTMSDTSGQMSGGDSPTTTRYTFLENVAHRSGWGSIEFSETWPRTGYMRGGRAYELPTSVPRISVSGCSSFILCHGWSGLAIRIGGGDGSNCGRCSMCQRHARPGRRWPEPGQLRGSDAAERGAGPIELLPTPTAREETSAGRGLTGALPHPSASDGIGGGPNNEPFGKGITYSVIDWGCCPTSSGASSRHPPMDNSLLLHPARPSPTATENRLNPHSPSG